MLPRIFCGVLTASVPVFLYFGINRSIPVFLESYFLNNVRYYPVNYSVEGSFKYLINLSRGAVRFTECHPVLLVFFAAGLLWCFLHQSKKIDIFLLLTFLTGFVLIFISGVFFPYYVMVFGCFSVFGVLWLYEIKAFSRIDLQILGILSYFFSVTVCLLFSANLYLLAFSRDDFPQFKVKEVIERSGIENPTILHYGLLDAGFNLPAGLVPEQRFWCEFNLQLPEMKSEQKESIEQGTTDFVITCHEPLYDADRYELIDIYAGDFDREGNSSLFYLYQRNDRAEK